MIFTLGEGSAGHYACHSEASSLILSSYYGSAHSATFASSSTKIKLYRQNC